MTPPTLIAVPDSVDARRTVRRVREGEGRRLTAAFEALDQFPALVESRDRVLELFVDTPDERVSTGALIEAIESDVAMAVAVLRIANQVQGPTRGRVTNLVQAAELLRPSAIRSLALRAETFDFFERSDAWDLTPEQFRLHALACQKVASRLADEAGWADRDELMTAALIHDVGKLAIVFAYPQFAGSLYGPARTPEERVRRERRELGVDHAVVGGVLARRWGLPRRLAMLIEQHHTDGTEGEVALVRLADQLAHYVQGTAVSPTTMLRLAHAAEIDKAKLRNVLFDLSGGRSEHQRHLDPCPLSEREIQVLVGLAGGKVYKQIGAELGLSTSTVRTHLHNIYRKLGARDRAQAVLVASERGWLN